jgi:UDP-N-acetyl-D-glucosamine dehydrogenase
MMSERESVIQTEVCEKIAVIGLGYVGLPLALLLNERGFHVLGIDLDHRKIDALLAGESYLTDVPDEAIKAVMTTGRFTPDRTYELLPTVNAIIICVPTPLTERGTPELSYLTQAGAELAPRLQHGQLVVLESSTYPGTTREVLLPLLERSGLKAGADFNLAYSPERVDPGNKEYPVEAIPKVISGMKPECLERVERLYKRIFGTVVPVASVETAEMAKILENAYRLINISFINELAMLSDTLGIDLWEVIEAAGTKPFGFKSFYPGPGIGGHCIPVDPSYLVWKLKQYGADSAFIELSNEINHRMPAYVVEQLKRALAPKQLSGARIIVYGAAYKPDIADCRESASGDLLKLLRLAGADASYHDPFVPSLQLEDEQLYSIALTEQALGAVDAVVIATAHSGMPLELLLEHAPLIYDARNATKGCSGRAAVVRLGGGAG